MGHSLPGLTWSGSRPSVMQVSGAFPVPLQDEDSLVGSLGVKKFRYFVVDSSVIMAILEQPLGPEEGQSRVSDLTEP